MQYTNVTFQALRQSDKKVIAGIESAIKESGLSVSGVNIKLTYYNGNIEFKKDKWIWTEFIKKYCASASALIDSCTYNLNPNISISYGRNRNDKEDSVTIGLKGLGEDQNESYLSSITKLSALLRKNLVATDEHDSIGAMLGQSAKDHYEKRDIELSRLQQISENFFETLSNFETERESLFLSKERLLEEKLNVQRNKIEEEYKKLLEDIENRRKVLDEREEKIDALDNRDARRKARDRMHDELKNRSSQFSLTSGTVSKRWPVHLTLVGVLLISSIVIFRMLEGFNVELLKDLPVVFQAWFFFRITILLIVIFTTAAYYVRWNNEWFQKHAEEEFRNKRFELDVERSTWLCEMAMEWEEATGREINTEFFKALSADLFIQQNKFDDQKINPAEQLASALLGAACQVKLKAGDNEMVFDRKSQKILKKQQ